MVRLVTPGDGVLVEAAPDGGLRDGDLVTAIGGAPLGADGGWRAPAQRPGDRLVYQVVRDGQPLAVPVTLRRAGVVDRLLQAWGTILFVVLLFVVVAYLYARRPARPPGRCWCSGAGC